MSCSTPRQYVVTAPSSGAITSLLFRRSSVGVSDPTGSEGSQGKNFLNLNVPVIKQNASENPAAGRVIVFWSESDDPADVSLASTVQLCDLGRGDALPISLSDYVAGWFYVMATGGAAIELHVTETRA